jgi:hypothetical protein
MDDGRPSLRCLIFSRDRPLQLRECLRTLLHQQQRAASAGCLRVQTTVVWAASDATFAAGYAAVASCIGSHVAFVQETDLGEQLAAMLHVPPRTPEAHNALADPACTTPAAAASSQAPALQPPHAAPCDYFAFGVDDALWCEQEQGRLVLTRPTRCPRLLPSYPKHRGCSPTTPSCTPACATITPRTSSCAYPRFGGCAYQCEVDTAATALRHQLPTSSRGHCCLSSVSAAMTFPTLATCVSPCTEQPTCRPRSRK